MAADFFQRQDAARRNTTRLVVLFFLAVIAIMASIHLVLALVFGYLAADAGAALDWRLFASPAILALSMIGTLVVVGGGSAFKIAQLAGGGHVVAEQVGGRLINPDTTDPLEQPLLNVVEEMAIASGTPVPAVYLLDNEPGINAFAAGFTPSDAVIGVTRGAVQHLTRDELQGVVAHEFSHILNGDMRLNIRLIGFLHGILIIGMLGYFILRAAAFSGRGHRRSSRQQGNPLPFIALGAGLAAIGFVGTFFGNMIKAAVSRQREFLADASAVQYTRLPEGIAGALKKIGAAATGSRIANPNAPEASHMFFGRATSGLSGMFSTHPPIEERIRRIEPHWDGTFPALEPRAEEPERQAAAAAASLAGADPGRVAAMAQMSSGLDQIGQPRAEHIRYARELIRSLPEPLARAAHEAYGARAVVYALLADRDAGVRQQQLRHLSAAADPHVFEETLRLLPHATSLDTRMRLPLIEMTLPALRSLTPEQYTRFRQNVGELVRADRAVDLFEWSLHRILVHDMDAQHERPPTQPVRHRSVESVREACDVLLSALAHAGHRDPGAAQQGFERARHRLGLPQAPVHAPADGSEALDRALASLEEASPELKRQVIEAAAACVTADGRVTVTEAEMLRAISASLGCPMPPLVA
jgi:Zn-dependent protease with chaperone function/histone H3/H4